MPSQTETQNVKESIIEGKSDQLARRIAAPSFEETLAEDTAGSGAETSRKAAVSRDVQIRSPNKGYDDSDPPPPYTEGTSPLEAFSYVMAATGGAASIITQVQQTGGPPVHPLGGMFF